jgi:predicted RecB family nuclease
MKHPITAHDLRDLTRCNRLVYLHRFGDPSRRLPPSAYEEWLREQGRAFEDHVIGALGARQPLVLVSTPEAAFEATRELMADGAQRIAQGTLLRDDLHGVPDLLERVEGASALGDYHYRPLDVKLATTAREPYRLQIMFYCWLLEAVQGRRPEGALLLRAEAAAEGDEALPYVETPVAFDEAALHARLAEARRLAAGEEPPPFISSTCEGCGWREVCLPIAEERRDVSLITGMRRRVWEQLHAAGLGTLEAVSQVREERLVAIRGVGDKTAAKTIRQARALVEGRAVRFGDPHLPAPGEGEAFFDIESYPPEDLHYLFGLLVQRGGQVVYEHELAERPGEERAAWHRFLERIDALDGPVYHYGTYERTTVRTLAGRYGGDPRAARLLDRLVDLRTILTSCAALPVRGYSLKQVAPWLGFEWTGATQAADDSMLAYDRWLRTGAREHLDGLLVYNEEDVRATRAIRNWLLGPGEG